jgi:hypothetical protein
MLASVKVIDPQAVVGVGVQELGQRGVALQAAQRRRDRALVGGAARRLRRRAA